MLFWHSAVVFNNVYSVPLLVVVGKGVKVILEVIGVVFIFDLIDVYDQIVNHQSSSFSEILWCFSRFIFIRGCFKIFYGVWVLSGPRSLKPPDL